MKTCSSCQRALAPNDFFCSDCGKTVGLDWVWIVYGTTLITGLQSLLLGVTGMAFLGDELAASLANPATANFLSLAVQVTLIAAVGYLLGGILVGRMSSAKTILEPGLAASFPAATFLLYLLSNLRQELSAMGLFLPALLLSLLVVLFCFFMALLGGYLGEHWQRYAQRGLPTPDARAMK
jgi:hypothetical protein